jgi:secretion/DNA translocation related CpaE-like protein
VPVPLEPARDRVPPARTLVVTSDERLLDDVLRLAAAAGVDVEVQPDPGGARPSWSRAALVLVGSDQTGAVTTAGLARRRGVVLVAHDLDDATVWRRAVALGAEHVAFLPDGEEWLVERVAAAQHTGGDGVVVGVVGGRGGAGASTLAGALGMAAMRAGTRPLLVDADPLGGGLDLLLGAEDAAGPRWPDLARTRGRLAPDSLGAALPDVGQVLVLSWDRGDVLAVEPEAMRAVLDAGARESPLVVVDLPRRADPAAEVALGRCDQVLLVVPAEVRAVAAAARVAAVVAPLTREVRVVVRGPAPSAIEPEVVAESLDLPLAGSCRGERGLAAALDRGEPPGSRPGPLARLADSLVRELLAARRQAA